MKKIPIQAQISLQNPPKAKWLTVTLIFTKDHLGILLRKRCKRSRTGILITRKVTIIF